MTWLFGLFGILLTVKPLPQMRYISAGDWRFSGSVIEVDVVATGDWRYTLLLAVHEAVEAWLCRRHGVTQERVDQWDMTVWPFMRQAWLTRPETHHPFVDPMFKNDEPGEHILAPYHTEHMAASRVERWLARLLLVNWQAYEARLAEVMG